MSSVDNQRLSEMLQLARHCRHGEFAALVEQRYIVQALEELQTLRASATEVEPWATAWQTSYTGDEWHFARQALFGAFDLERGIVKNVTPLYAQPSLVDGVSEEMVERVGEAIYGRHDRGFVMWPLVDGDRQKRAIRAALSHTDGEDGK